MLLSHVEWLCIILPTLIAATPQKTVPTSSESPIPAKLQQEVPACAQPCLQSSLAEQFPLACTNPANLSCLCSRYSFEGEALGEVALGCIYAFCSPVDSRAAAAYNICLGQQNAVTPTLTVLTVAVKSSSASSSMVTSPPVITTKPSSTITSTASQSDSVAVDSISLAPSSTSISEPVTTPLAAADPPKTMKPAQIAGLSVAAAATFIIAIGLMALSVFLRKRRERKRAVDALEKKAFPSPEDYSAPFPTYPPHDPSFSVRPQQFPLAPAPVVRKAGRNSSALPTRAANSTPYSQWPHDPMIRPGRSSIQHSADFSSIHPLLRPKLPSSNNSSDSSVPLDQIGLAISAELPNKPVQPMVSSQPPRKAQSRTQRPKSLQRDANPSQRPESGVTEDTVFEEDDIAERRRETRLLPTPPFPIPPIRSFQPSRPAPRVDVPIKSVQSSISRRQQSQQPELFLDIPIRHSRFQPQPKNMGPPVDPSTIRPAPVIQVHSDHSGQSFAATTASTPDPINGWDIPDYYFTAHQNPTPKRQTPPGSLSRVQRSKGSLKDANIKPKFSSSNVSQATSRNSTNLRDSISSQTSFESVDSNDPTPEEDEERQLSDDSKLSPVAESPISNLRYPKVPRASNQLVPRSPRSPQSQKSQDSPRRLPDSPMSISRRRGLGEPLKLGSPLHSGSPVAPEAREHIRRYRQHLRSNSVETWSPAPSSNRATRVLSSQFPKSPAMYDQAFVKPLNIRSKQSAPPSIEMESLKSPLWVPRLTPQRHGDDLLISVTYSRDGR